MLFGIGEKVFHYIPNDIIKSIFVTRFGKTGHNSAFIEIHFIALAFWALKAFFCSNIRSAVAISGLPVLQRDSQLQAVKARDTIHGFVCIPMAIEITRI